MSLRRRFLSRNTAGFTMKNLARHSRNQKYTLTTKGIPQSRD